MSRSWSYVGCKLALVWCVLLLASDALAEDSKPSSKRVILFIIDGLAIDAPELFDMPNWSRLAREGSRYRAMHLPLPGHPKNDPRYPWSCSMPNPMLMSGTPFIGVDGIRTAMIQHQFKDKRTAFVVNARSYADVSDGFGKYASMPQSPDAWVLENAKEVLLRDRPVFMRMHMQRPGIEGEKVSKERYADKPYYRDIWHSESPYRTACELADKHLGEFVAWLKDQNLWDETVLLLCGDHGQASEGWHEPYSESSSATPLIIVGAGIPAGRTFDYCEIFDIAPTIAYLTGVETPRHSIGRVLSEALDATLAAPKPAQNVEQLNRILRASNALAAEQKTSLTKAGFLSIDELGLWHTTEAGVDFAAFVLRQRKLYEEQRAHSQDPLP